jgi:hypothetical protein
MKEQTKLDRFINWLDKVFSRYDCNKNRHEWCYKLSESGIIYMNDNKVPKEMWFCRNCGIKKFNKE